MSCFYLNLCLPYNNCCKFTLGHFAPCYDYLLMHMWPYFRLEHAHLEHTLEHAHVATLLQLYLIIFHFLHKECFSIVTQLHM